jgi:polysaccharide export outer membrane protein
LKNIFLLLSLIAVLQIQLNAQSLGDNKTKSSKENKSQSFPDYKERTFDVSDTLFQYVTATEGNVDADTYILGPGDKIFISVSGLEEVVFNLVIDQEGNLYIPKVGGIDLKNSTLSEGRNKIVSAVNKYYKNVDVFVTLLDFRKIKVSLLGNVKYPSSRILSANSRLMDLITSSNGLVETSNYRNIKIVSKDNVEKFYDLLRYLRYGDKSNNPFLHEGDVVLVDRVDKVVTINGEVKFPGIYEFVDGENVNELINLAGGFTHLAKKDTVEVVSFDDEGKIQKSKYCLYSELENNPVELKVQDRVIVRQIPEYYIDRFVKVEGQVKYPGQYKIVKDSTTLKEVIHEAGGFMKDASLTEASLTRTIGSEEYDPEYERLKQMPRADMTDEEYDYLKAKSRERPGNVVVDFEKLFRDNDLNENVILEREDVINIPEAKNYVNLLGQLVTPGKIIYKEGLTVYDYIQLAGGFGWRALEDEVRVVKAKTGEWIEADDVDSLDPGDTIWVPEDPPGPKFWEVFTTVLQVTGQIATVIAATVAVIVATR